MSSLKLRRRKKKVRQKRQIGRYTLFRELGHGSYNQVFEAFHLLTGERVALKFALEPEQRGGSALTSPPPPLISPRQTTSLGRDQAPRRKSPPETSTGSRLTAASPSPVTLEETTSSTGSHLQSSSSSSSSPSSSTPKPKFRLSLSPRILGKSSSKTNTGEEAVTTAEHQSKDNNDGDECTESDTVSRACSNSEAMKAVRDYKSFTCSSNDRVPSVEGDQQQRPGSERYECDPDERTNQRPRGSKYQKRLLRSRRQQRSLSYGAPTQHTPIDETEQTMEAQEQLQNEGLLLMLIDHPNIVFLKEFLVSNDELVLAEELLEGPTLYDWLASTPFPSSSSSEPLSSSSSSPSPPSSPPPPSSSTPASPHLHLYSPSCESTVHLSPPPSVLLAPLPLSPSSPSPSPSPSSSPSPPPSATLILRSPPRTGSPHHTNEHEHLRSICSQMANAVCYLHELGICHRDLKLENFILILASTPRVKLADFGFACLTFNWRSQSGSASVEGIQTSFVGSLHYVAPEVASRIPYHGTPADLWSLGVCFFALLHRRLPFYQADRMQLLEAVQKGKARECIDPDLNPAAHDLLSRLLEPSPQLRMTASELIDHPWLSGGTSLSMSFSLALGQPAAQPFLPSWCFDNASITTTDHQIVLYLMKLGFSQQWIVEQLETTTDNTIKTYYRILLARLSSSSHSTNRSSPRNHLIASVDSPRGFAALWNDRLLPILSLRRPASSKGKLHTTFFAHPEADPPAPILLPQHLRLHS